MTRWEKRLMLQTAYCTLSVVAFLASLGLFNYKYQPNWYIYFTNLANYFCMVFMGIKLYNTIRNRGTDYDTTSPGMEYVGVVLLSATFCIFNFVIAPAKGRDPALNVAVSSVLLHETLPPLFLLDWFLFYRRGQSRWKDFLCSLIPAFVFFVFIQLRAPFVKEINGIKKYPYFFVNLDTLGYAGLVKWFFIVMAAFVVLALIWYWLDHFLAKKEVSV